MKMKVEMDLRDVQRAMGAFSDQAPWATKRALDKVAFKARNHVVKRVWPTQVKRRAKGFMGRAMRVIKANKYTLTAVVHVDESRVSPEGVEAVDRLIKGQPHFPYNGQYLAIPVRYDGLTLVLKSGKLSKRGRALLDKNNPKTFVADLKGKGPAIWHRTSTGRRLLFVLKPKVKTPAKFRFSRSIERFVKKRWKRIIELEMKNAIKTAFR